MEEQASREGGATVGARCALHPIQPAIAVCSRCGNYMCAECSEPGRPGVCPPCRERTGSGAFPFDRASFDLGNVITFAFERFKEQWLVPCIGIVLAWGISFGFSMVDVASQLGVEAMGEDMAAGAVGVSVMLNIVSYVLQTGVQLGIVSACLVILQGGRAEPAHLFSQFGRIPHALAQILVLMLPVAILIGIPAGIAAALGLPDVDSLLLAVGLSIGAVLLLPVLVYVALGLAFMQVELVHDPEVGPLEAIGRSWRIVSGKRLWLMVMWFVLFALSIAGLLACCVGLIPAAGLGSLVMVGIYLALRNGAEL